MSNSKDYFIISIYQHKKVRNIISVSFLIISVSVIFWGEKLSFKGRFHFWGLFQKIKKKIITPPPPKVSNNFRTPKNFQNIFVVNLSLSSCGSRFSILLWDPSSYNEIVVCGNASTIEVKGMVCLYLTCRLDWLDSSPTHTSHLFLKCRTVLKPTFVEKCVIS